MSMQWKVLALILRARAKMRALLSKVYKSKEKMKLYCFLFPGDYEFERETLIQLWMAMEFSEQRCAENFSKIYFDMLVKEEYISFSRVDVLSGKTMYKVNQHKVKLLSDKTTHTMEIIDDNYTFLEYDETNNVGSKKSCHVSLVSSDINQVSFKELTYGGLRTLLFLRNYGSSLKQIPPGLFFTLELVQALDLSGSHIIELPISIRNLSQLRYLDLSFTPIECLPESIGRLCQLQTLKLQGCRHLYELPKGMKELIRLQHLEFDVLGQLTFLPKGIGALTEIQTLSAFIVDSKEGCNIRELKGMNNLRGRCCISGLENVSSSDAHEAFLLGKKHLINLQLRWNDLKLYSIEDQHEAYNIIANLELNKGLEELQITCYPAMELPAWVNFREQVNLVRITLFKCENNVVALPLGKLPNLKDLIIIHMNRVTKIDNLVRGGYEQYAAFPRLERLEIVCMSSLESWDDVLPDDFPLLSKLFIKQCPKLNSLAFIPQLNSLEHLEISHCTAFKCLPDGTLPTNLKTFIVHDCPTLEMNCSEKGKDWEKMKHVQEIWIDYENISCFHEDIVDGGDKGRKSSTSEDIICSAALADDESSTEGIDTNHTIIDLPDNCLSYIQSLLTSPRDIIRSSLVCKQFLWSSRSDTIWNNFLPSDINEIVSQSSTPHLLQQFTSKKELILHLCSHSVLLNGETQSFALSKWNGKKCYMFGARALKISWEKDPHYWNWRSLPESRFPEIAELLAVCWLHIEADVNRSILTPRTTYGAYFVFKMDVDNHVGFENTQVKVTMSEVSEVPEGDESSVLPPPRIVSVNFFYLTAPSGGNRNLRSIDELPNARDDGWMEIEMGRYYVVDDVDERVMLRMTLTEIEELHCKSGLLVQGVELRPLDHD